MGKGRVRAAEAGDRVGVPGAGGARNPSVRAETQEANGKAELGDVGVEDAEKGVTAESHK